MSEVNLSPTWGRVTKEEIPSENQQVPRDVVWGCRKNMEKTQALDIVAECDKFTNYDSLNIFANHRGNVWKKYISMHWIHWAKMYSQVMASWLNQIKELINSEVQIVRLELCRITMIYTYALDHAEISLGNVGTTKPGVSGLDLSAWHGRYHLTSFWRSHHPQLHPVGEWRWGDRRCLSKLHRKARGKFLCSELDTSAVHRQPWREEGLLCRTSLSQLIDSGMRVDDEAGRTHKHTHTH